KKTVLILLHIVLSVVFTPIHQAVRLKRATNVGAMGLLAVKSGRLSRLSSPKTTAQNHSRKKIKEKRNMTQGSAAQSVAPPMRHAR
ncbi:hypothetical protein, partial [Plesiomonas shigelloides]|uniref:hypothetical protein n=1 Tax=Plesiomonas shigelloides TaxID=703 RepID=UPI001C499321